MPKQKKVLLIYTALSSFVRVDKSIIEEFADVNCYRFSPNKSLLTFSVSMINQFFYLLFYSWKYDVLISWFCDYHSFLPTVFAKITGKKVYIISGGFDTTNIPSLKYGLFYKINFRAKVARFAYRNATAILPVDASLIENTNTYNPKETLVGGIKNYVPGLKTPFYVLPTGYDPEFWKKKENIDKKPKVLTVSVGDSDLRFRLKGIDIFVDIAEKLPAYEFTIVGVGPTLMELINSRGLSNLTVIGTVNREELVNLYSEHKVYAQFSLSEGLPNVLCEAMLCECIGVGSSVNGIPYGIGKGGYVLKEKSLPDAVTIVKKALEDNTELGKVAREHIVSTFSLQKRIDKLKELILEG